MNIITVEEFQAYAPEVDLSKYTNATISGMISMASKQVADYLGYMPLAEDIVDEKRAGIVTREGDLLIYTAKVPIQSVSSVSVVKATTSLNITLLNSANNPIYDMDFTKRSIRIPNSEVILEGNSLFRDFYYLRGGSFFTKVSYRGGFEVSELPSVIKEATMLFMRDLTSRQFNVSGAERIRQGGIEIEFSQRGELLDGRSDLVRDGEFLLRPYRRIV